MSEPRTQPRPVVVRRVAGAVLLVSALVLTALGTAAPVAAAPVAAPRALYLVTLDGPGTSGDPSPLPRAIVRLRMLAQQDRVLDDVDHPAPVYRWTAALNGFAVELTGDQAAELAADPDVAIVERNSVHRLAGVPTTSTPDLLGGRRTEGGEGVVVGIVDSGITPDSPLFAAVPGLGRAPEAFHGGCQPGQDWAAETCNSKVVAAGWFVRGFGADRVRTSSSLSARDDDGHGTEMASIAAGNPGPTVRVNGERLGAYSGIAPQARVAAYKACWTAPDPDDDGCATADLVSAIDRATADGVDVLNLSVAGPDGYDTVEQALLGAAEADIVVVAAAGNGHDRLAAHPAPWVTTVGGAEGAVRRGTVTLSSGRALRGVTAATKPLGPAGLVLGSAVAARGASAGAAGICTPGSLDAGRVGGRVVLCERGGIGRVDKSRAVYQADGVGMVLANASPGSLHSDFQVVPTVHLDAGAARTLRSWAIRHPRGRVTLAPTGVDRSRPAVLGSSRSGDPTASVLKPDVVAPASDLVGAVPPQVRGARWDVVSGTSAAAAWTSGVAAVALDERDWSAATVRSALATTASHPSGTRSVLRAGAGLVRPGEVESPGLGYEVDRGDYRAWLNGDLDELNTASIVLDDAQSSTTRTITNLGSRARYFSSSTSGFGRHRVQVTPAAVRLAPGRSATFTVRVSGRRVPRLDQGYVTWRGATGTVTRIPVLLTR